MDHVVARYGEIGTKSTPVRQRMLSLLSRRIEERLTADGFEHDRVPGVQGRLVYRTPRAPAAAAVVAELPGVASASPALRTEPALEAILAASDRVEVGPTFGVRANRAGDHPFTSQDLERVVGARVVDRTGASVDLDQPSTWVEVDAREQHVFVFTRREDGPGGFPVGAEGTLAALISGGIDSPVAAYEVMTRGCDIVPVYCYNRPLAAADHRARFEAVLGKLSRFHAGKSWYYYLVDMEAVNERLLEFGRGRMLLHRMVMFRAAAAVARREGLSGVVTGEAIGQKSSQTPENLARTSAAIDLPVFRPLLTRPKDAIVELARALGTFEEATIASACRSLAPAHPATAMGADAAARLTEDADLEGLVALAAEATERVDLAPAQVA